MALTALILLTWLPVTRGASPDHARNTQRQPVLFKSILPVLVDLDGDYAADKVSLRSNGPDKTVNIKFANQRTTEFSFDAKSVDQGTLIAKDIDGDGDLDLIWVPDRDQKNAVVLINDGKGDFTEAKDNAPYTAALNALLGDHDSSNQNSLQTSPKSLSLTSQSSPDISLAVVCRLPGPTVHAESFFGVRGLANRSVFLSYLHKRGPPVTLS